MKNFRPSVLFIVTVLSLQIFSTFTSTALVISLIIKPEHTGDYQFSSAIAHKCPLCGMTRAFINMAHGNINMAGNYNARGPVLFVLFILMSCAGICLLPFTVYLFTIKW